MVKSIKMQAHIYYFLSNRTTTLIVSLFVCFYVLTTFRFTFMFFSRTMLIILRHPLMTSFIPSYLRKNIHTNHQSILQEVIA